MRFDATRRSLGGWFESGNHIMGPKCIKIMTVQEGVHLKKPVKTLNPDKGVVPAS
jgi:hypothetical protein